jgi:hypothetical protein
VGDNLLIVLFREPTYSGFASLNINISRAEASVFHQFSEFEEAVRLTPIPRWVPAVLFCVVTGFAQTTTPATAQSSANVPDAPVAPPRLDAAAVRDFQFLDATDAIDSQDSPSSSQPAQNDSTQQRPVSQNPPPSDRPQQTKRILGIIPNFRSVSTDEILPPQSTREKFMTATSDSFDYSSIFIPAALAGYSLGTNATPELGQGAAGYGRYFWRAAIDQTSENYMVEFVFPVITRQDNRYYTLGRGGFFRRTGYALSRVVITRDDASRETFNTSEVVGAGASAGLSNLYYPASSRSFGNTGKQWGINVGIDAVSFVAKEFWPDINHRLFHQDDVIEGAKQ